MTRRKPRSRRNSRRRLNKPLLITVQTKADIRQQIRTRKALLTPSQMTAYSATVCRGVLHSPKWRMAHCVLLYHPLPDEVDIRPLIADAYSRGCTVLLPAVIGRDVELRIYGGIHSLRPGAYGIMEPTGPLFPPAQYGSIDLALVPGMAFTAEGHRLGRGKGYYDRLLPLLPNAWRMGICFPFQLLPAIPTEPHDVCMHQICN